VGIFQNVTRHRHAVEDIWTGNQIQGGPLLVGIGDLVPATGPNPQVAEELMRQKIDKPYFNAWSLPATRPRVG